MKLTSSLLTALGVAALGASTAQANLLVSSGSWTRLYSDTGTQLVSYSETDSNYQGNTTDGTNAYFADFNVGGIRKYNLATGAFISNVTDNSGAFFGAFTYPVFGLASKSPTDLIASYTLGGNHHFVHVNPGATNVVYTAGNAQAPTYEGIAYGPGDVLYSTKGNALQSFSGTDGTFSGRTVLTGSALKGVAYDSFSGAIFTADFSTGEIFKTVNFGLLGQATTVFASGLGSAYGVATDGLGNVYASSYSTGDIKKYNSLGAVLNTYNVGAANPTYITFTPVPEPSTYAFYALVGLSGLGLMVRRKWLRSA